ncbi:MAG TPA: response regulator transcription factor [Blastocatellia bacterium]|nr:response regulator transcription factor [Blastocatellia bacterium]
MKLLIVDDSEKMRRVIKGFIVDLADQCYECGDGAQAVSAYARYRPDWVFMDIKMRDMDGLEATRKIVSAFPGARVVIVTSYDDAELREEALESGACDYVLKDNLFELRSILIRGARAGC